ncbi:GNAT family N-acetyltransferase [Evansella tamaricis]|uniref:GNAT family N-acetyltransferase n=1 Tax=Evansella tamaricis TaxID=2069301 RepID=A0ABS6JAY8_9BACI|nr:GNAT family N-acetyltransferase [Evansella tamaricis]MBU9710848.1 GNAT family N-acetyltransferase [Evansella tamaricis]
MITLNLASKSEKNIINNLMQFYFYDFSEFVDAYVKEDGLFEDYSYLDAYWEENDRYPYLIWNDNRLVGFALIRKINTAGDYYFSIAEFFIMKKFRRNGLGKLAAQTIFRNHKGPWEVFQIANNHPAQSFWRKTIQEFTSGHYEERILDGKTTQYFISK